MENQSYTHASTPKNGVIDDRVRMGAVTLSVANLDRSLAYYHDRIGLRLLDSASGRVTLGAGDTPLLHLVEEPGARRARGVTGLYHFAIRVPSRQSLARVIQHIIETQTPVTGASDHGVSEALYLSDPDGHGIEIYRDRPRDQWLDAKGEMVMFTDHLDIESILSELADDNFSWNGIDQAADMGHVHLHVADIASSEAFYLGLIGFEKPFKGIGIPSASFVSAGGYHHHLGMNLWAGAGAPPPSQGMARLLRYEILFPDSGALQPVLSRLAEAGVPVVTGDGGWAVEDPSSNSILLRVG